MVNGTKLHLTNGHHRAMSDQAFLQRVLAESGERAWANLSGLRNMLALPGLHTSHRRSSLDERRVVVELEVEPGRWEWVWSIHLDLENFRVIVRRGGEHEWVFEPGKLPEWRSESNAPRAEVVS